ncbi:Uncharacterised protein [Mycobacterium tuberculosis]|nr:Uncharacterised protein [Mycobacterium tuberculosis]
MVEKVCSRSHGQPVLGVRSAAMMSRSLDMSWEGGMAHRGMKRACPLCRNDGLETIGGRVSGC